MSKTDKDRPPWVRAKDDPNRVASHHYRCEVEYPYGSWWATRMPRHPCDIDERHAGYCHYFERDRSWHSAPPRWFRRHRWYDPEHNDVRMDCVKAIKEYRGSGDTDVMPSIQQHRHGASWDWD